MKVERIIESHEELGDEIDLTELIYLMMPCKDFQHYLVNTKGLNVNIVDKNGVSPLIQSIRNIRRNQDVRSFELPRLYCDAGANLDFRTFDGRTALHYACLEQHLGLVRFIASISGVNLVARDFYGLTPLDYAIKYDNEPIIEFLSNELSVDPLVNDPDGEFYLARFPIPGFSRCKSACFLNNLELAQSFCDEHEDLVSALHFAIRGNSLEVIEFLVKEKNVPIDGIDEETRYNSLMLACRVSNVEVVRYLVEEAGAVVSQSDLILKIACCRTIEDLHVVRYIASLISAESASVPVYDNDELSWAIREFNTGTIRYLVETLSFRLDRRDSNRRTPLQQACDLGSLRLMKLLIELGADPEQANENNYTIIFNATVGGKLAVVKYLAEDVGVNLNHRDRHGRTILLIASMTKNAELVQYLTDAGVDDTLDTSASSRSLV